MAGTPAAFQSSAFDNAAFQTGGGTAAPPSGPSSGQGLSGWQDEIGIEQQRMERRARMAEAKERLALFERRQEELKAEYDRARKVKKQARAKREAEALAYRQAMAGVLQSIDRLNIEVEGYASQLMQLDMLLAAAESEIGLRIEFERQNMNALALLLLS